MIGRLKTALQHIEEVPPAQQDELADLIEAFVAEAQFPALRLPSYAGAVAGLLPDDAEEELLRLRRETLPSPPVEDQLRGLMDDKPA